MLQVAVHGGAWKRAGTALQVLLKVLPCGLCYAQCTSKELQSLHNCFVFFTLHLNGNRNSQPSVCKWCYGVCNLSKLQFASEVADCVAGIDVLSGVHDLLLHNSKRFSLKLAKPFACLNAVYLLKPHPGTVTGLHIPTSLLPLRPSACCKDSIIQNDQFSCIFSFQHRPFSCQAQEPEITHNPK